MRTKEELKECLINGINCLDSDCSTYNEQECEMIIDFVNGITNTKNKYSKYQACKYLGISRSTFDNGVREGKLPEGRQEQGFKEKFWYLRDLKMIKNEK